MSNYFKVFRSSNLYHLVEDIRLLVSVVENMDKMSSLLILTDNRASI